MKQLLLTSVALGLSLALAGPASATYLTFFGEDINTTPDVNNPPGNVPLASLTNSNAANVLYRQKLASTVGTETFETFASGTTGSLQVNFAGNGVQATLSGGLGEVIQVDQGTSSFGKYSVPSPLPGQTVAEKLWAVDVSSDSASTFEVNFSTSVAAFGFYGIDVGDQGGKVELDLLDDKGNVITSLSYVTGDLLHSTSTNSSTDGSVFFFGFVAGASDPLFNGVRFRSSAPSTNPDGIGFDNFSVALRSEIQCTVNCGGGPVPEPQSILLLATALLGLRLAGRRKT